MKKFFLTAGLILAVLAGCAQWNWQNPLPQGNDLSSVFFVNNQIGYNVGDCGVVVKTTDGGTTWSIMNSGTTSRLSSVYFTDALTGFAVGDGGTLINTSDGGVTFIDDAFLPAKSFSVYPNPAAENITVRIPEILSKCRLSIMNLSSQELFVQNITGTIAIIDISHLPAGVYLLRLENDLTVKVEKMIKL